MRLFPVVFELAAAEFGKVDDVKLPDIESLTHAGASLDFEFECFSDCMKLVFELDELCKDYLLDVHFFVEDKLLSVFEIYWLHRVSGLTLPLYGFKLLASQAHALCRAQFDLELKVSPLSSIRESKELRSKVVCIVNSRAYRKVPILTESYSILNVIWDVEL